MRPEIGLVDPGQAEQNWPTIEGLGSPESTPLAKHAD